MKQNVPQPVVGVRSALCADELSRSDEVGREAELGPRRADEASQPVSKRSTETKANTYMKEEHVTFH